MATYADVQNALMKRNFEPAVPNAVADQSAWKAGKSEVWVKVGESRTKLTLVLVDIPQDQPPPRQIYSKEYPAVLPPPEQPKVIVQAEMEGAKKAFRLSFEEFLASLQAELTEEPAA